NAQGDDAQVFGNFDLALRFVEPFDYGHGVCRFEVGFKTGAENLVGGFETVQIQMGAGQPAGAVFVHESKGGGMDAFGDSEAAREPADKLGFASTEIANQPE